jgi:hypothetical protein
MASPAPEKERAIASLEPTKGQSMTDSSSAPRKHFRVFFWATTHYKITLEARSEQEAITRAKRIWRDSGDKHFIAFAGDSDGWGASEG